MPKNNNKTARQSGSTTTTQDNALDAMVNAVSEAIASEANQSAVIANPVVTNTARIDKLSADKVKQTARTRSADKLPSHNGIAAFNQAEKTRREKNAAKSATKSDRQTLLESTAWGNLILKCEAAFTVIRKATNEIQKPESVSIVSYTELVNGLRATITLYERTRKRSDIPGGYASDLNRDIKTLNSLLNIYTAREKAFLESYAVNLQTANERKAVMQAAIQAIKADTQEFRAIASLASDEKTVKIERLRAENTAKKAKNQTKREVNTVRKELTKADKLIAAYDKAANLREKLTGKSCMVTGESAVWAVTAYYSDNTRAARDMFLSSKGLETICDSGSVDLKFYASLTMSRIQEDSDSHGYIHIRNYTLKAGKLLQSGSESIEYKSESAQTAQAVKDIEPVIFAS